MTHAPVMTEELLHGLAPLGPAARVVDGTFGRGGHARAVLSLLGSEGRVVGLDWDEEAVQAGLALARADTRFKIVRAAFGDLLATLQRELNDAAPQVDAVLLDLGVSSPQLDSSARGFSFLHDGPLDMRMDQRAERTAALLVNTASDTEIADVLFNYGDERFSRRIARAIVAARATEPFATTLQLATVVAAAHPRWPRHQHPATRTFQALRIWVNDEGGQLSSVLGQLRDVIRIGGRALVISFHSGEDRQVKHAFQGAPTTRDPRIARLPTSGHSTRSWQPVGGAQRASSDEVASNPRARSAVLRIAERVA